jgi:hypothetical protein
VEAFKVLGSEARNSPLFKATAANPKQTNNFNPKVFNTKDLSN